MTLADFFAHVQTHVELAAGALFLAAAIGIPLGIFSAHVRRARGAALALFNVGRVVPSLAVLTFVLPSLHVGFVPSLVALTVLAIPPIAINTDLGFREVPAATIDAARGMGMSDTQTLFRVEWPLALPVLFAGVRTATIEVIASATLASFIGGGGLGDYILQGLSDNQPRVLLTGVAAVSTLALLAELALSFIGRRLTLAFGEIS
ncbi:MAG: ABC transporter permease [Candidatus Eremiobacteraeota bacterium]|nr:ABC transporter permease [Candidatus Eremiobacteraeota bacterium]